MNRREIIAGLGTGQGELTVWKYGWQPTAGGQHRDLFHPPGEEGAVADHDRTNMLLRESFEGRFEIAIGSGIPDNELQAQRARRRLQVHNDGWGSSKGRVHENAKRGSTGYQLAKQLQFF